jgi:hypothetical protein
VAKLSKADRRLAKWQYRSSVGPLTEEEKNKLMDEVYIVYNSTLLYTIVHYNNYAHFVG